MENKHTFSVHYKDGDVQRPDFEVISFTGRESISMPYRFDIALRSETDISNISLIGKEATLTIYMVDTDVSPAETDSSSYNGIIVSFSIKGRIDKYFYYFASLAPKLSTLGLFRKSDVFVSQPFYSDGSDCIIKVILKDGKIMGEDYDIQLSNSAPYQPTSDPYNRWAYVCQYEETHLGFLSRLMEREGIFYFFKQLQDKKEQVVITDKNSNGIKRQKKLKYRFTSEQSTAPDPDAIYEIVMNQKMLPQKVIITNHGYEKASQGEKGVISCSAFISKDGNEDKNLQGEIRIYGENFVNLNKDGDGNYLAQVRAQEIYCRGKIYSGKSTAVPLSAGMIITLDEGASNAFKGDYFILEVAHTASQIISQSDISENTHSFYENTFAMIPLDVQFRPERKTPLPKIYGTVNAYVDGEQDSNYAQIDDKGRYKVRLPFLSRSKGPGKDSVWIRMATPYGGSENKTYGMHFPLHKGAEVIITFRDGDPDKPVITGTLYNSQSTNPVTAKNKYEHKIETYSGNMIVMSDKEGEQYIHMYSPGGSGSTLLLGNGKDDDGTWNLTSTSQELVTGARDSIVVGSDNELIVGSDNGIAIGPRLEVSIGAKSEMVYGPHVEVKGGASVEFGETRSTIREKQDITAVEEVKLSAGLDAAGKMAYKSLHDKLSVLFATVIPLLNAGVTEAVARGAKPEGMLTKLLSGGGNFIVTLGLTIALNKILSNFISTMESIPKKSNIIVDEQGVVINTSSGNGMKGISMELRERPLTFTRAGDLDPSNYCKSVINIRNDGSIQLNNDNKATLKMGTNVQVNEDFLGAGNHIALKTKNGRIEIARKDGGRINVDAQSVMIDGESDSDDSGQITLDYNSVVIKQGEEGPSCTMDKNGFFVEHDNCSLTVKNQQGITMKAPNLKAGPNGRALTISPTGLIQLGE